MTRKHDLILGAGVSEPEENHKKGQSDSAYIGWSRVSLL